MQASVEFINQIGLAAKIAALQCRRDL